VVDLGEARAIYANNVQAAGSAAVQAQGAAAGALAATGAAATVYPGLRTPDGPPAGPIASAPAVHYGPRQYPIAAPGAESLRLDNPVRNEYRLIVGAYYDYDRLDRQPKTIASGSPAWITDTGAVTWEARVALHQILGPAREVVDGLEGWYSTPASYLTGIEYLPYTTADWGGRFSDEHDASVTGPSPIADQGLTSTSTAATTAIAPKSLLKVMVKVRRFADGTAEFVLHNGRRIKIRNAEFISSWVTLPDIAAFTNVSLETIKAVQQKFPGVKIFYNEFGQPIFTNYAKATVRLPDLMAGKYVADYAKKAWAKLEADQPALARMLKKDDYRWHHAGNGELQLIDKDLHTAFQHTGLNSVLKQQLSILALLIPGTEQFKEGDISGAAREIVITFTPFSLSQMGGYGLCAFYDECCRELEESSTSLGPQPPPRRPPVRAELDATRERLRKAGIEVEF